MYSPSVQAVPASSPFYDAALKVPTRDVAKAKALLKQAGVTLPVKLELLTFNDPDKLQAAEVIQSMAAEAGFDVHIQAIEFASSLQASRRGDYQAYMIGWSGRVDIDGNTYAFLHSGRATTRATMRNPTVDKLLDEGARHDRSWPSGGRSMRRCGRRTAAGSAAHLSVTPRNIVGMSAKLNGFRPCPTA